MLLRHQLSKQLDQEERECILTNDAKNSPSIIFDLGGDELATSLQAGLIEDIVLTVIPVLIGGGCPLFGEVAGDVKLKLVRSEAFPSGMVQSHYKILNPK